MHKLFKSKNIMGAFYALIVSLPIFSILGRVLYTQWNPNSKDSYYGDVINQNEVVDFTYSEMIPGYDYYLANELLTGTYATTSQSRMTLQVHSIEGVTYTDSQIGSMYQLAFYVNSSFIPRLYFYDSNNTSIGAVIDLDTKNVRINFTFLGWINPQNNLPLINDIDFYTYKYLPSTYLDNAFEYSLSTFIDENNFGKLNLFQWFDNMFLSNNQHNNLYIHFVNWYFNYFFYVSLGYILFLFIMWFVNFARRILEKSFNYDIGGY